LMGSAPTVARLRPVFTIANVFMVNNGTSRSMTWGQVLPRETGEAQLAIVGKGDKPRNVLLPAELATALAHMRGDAPADARVFPITERRINYIVKSAAKRAGINPAISAHWLRHAHASHAIERRADHACLADPRARRPEDDERLRPRQAERLFESVPQEELSPAHELTGPARVICAQKSSNP
jgi:integrase